MSWAANTFKVWELKAFSLQKGSGVDSIVYQKPEEDFMLQSHSTFPKHFGESIGCVLSHEMLVNCS